MPRCSESVAALAAALAKAQGVLVNPEKSLDRYREERPAGGGGAQLSLRAAVERLRHRAQDPRPARDRDHTDDRYRPDRPVWSI